jgi:membrane protease YdiL (CAAX protease family)
VISHARTIGWAFLLSLLTAVVASSVWSGLIIANARTSPGLPWSIPVMAALLAGYWLYLGGRGRPRSTQAARAALLRARVVPLRTFGLAWLAGGLSLAALAGLWIVLEQLTGSGGNPTEAQLAGFPVVLVAAAIGMGSLVSPVSEEASYRGYAQVILERRYPPLAAVALSSAFFSFFHGPTQGFFWSKLLFFFLVGVVFGTIAYLTDSTLPAIPVHIAGDLLFFIFIWPQDAHRPLVAHSGPDGGFWLALALLAVFTPLALLAFRTLSHHRASKP